MQDNWLHKIRTHESLPPAETWANITKELDKDDKNTTEDVTTKILAYEATPPASALSNIFDQLDQEESATPVFVEKIKNCNQLPPANALTNIFNQLDATEELATPGFVEKIKNYTQAPPAAAWQNIIGELDKDENVIQLYPKKNNIKSIYLRIAAAAAVIAIVWITVISNNKKITPDVAKTTPNKSENSLPTTVINPVTPPIAPPQTKEQQKNDVAVTPANKTIPVKPLETLPTNYIKSNQVQDLAQSPAMNKKEKLQNIHGETPTDIALLNTPNTYLSMTGADGQSVKVSSKFSNLIAAFSNNSETKEGIDIIIDESAKWRPIIEAWKNKMTNNSIAPSFSNFMDIIALSEILEDKK